MFNSINLAEKNEVTDVFANVYLNFQLSHLLKETIKLAFLAVFQGNSCASDFRSGNIGRRSNPSHEAATSVA